MMKKSEQFLIGVFLSVLSIGFLLPMSAWAQEETTVMQNKAISTETTFDTKETEWTSQSTTQTSEAEGIPHTNTSEEVDENAAETESASSTAAVPIYRLYHPGTGKHLYTTDENEKNVLYNQRGWGYEGIGWYAAKNGIPVYRIYNPILKNHLYTQDTNEVRILTSSHGWVSDNNGRPVFYSNGSVNVYRLYNKQLQGRHHWTTDENEYKILPRYGWKQEQVKFKAIRVGHPIQTQFKENLPSGSRTIANTPSKMTIESEVSLSGSGTGYHAKLVMVTPTSGISFGIQYDTHARAPHTGKTSFMVENIEHNQVGGQTYQWTNLYARSGASYRLMLVLQNDGSYTGYVNGAEVISGRNPALANRSDIYLRVEGAARKTGDSINANFRHIKLKQNGYYDSSRQWVATPRFNRTNGLLTKIDNQLLPNTPSGDRALNGTVNISGRLVGLPSYADWDTAGYYDKISGLLQFY